ncbi:type II toxin-antitoxin system VapC family toxin [Novosphingobium acidiphilum]|uniref:type II toxin-antitoxin system VapC family toxin n=1 Tax=Novosphingobium acidiphilum TaxID=505248 RepID=UPI00048ACF85|nr:type II toxin-antitoxin system VapC family toxin [Novosphingobium acidiphilum]
MFILDTNAISELRKGPRVPSAAPIVAWAAQVEEERMFISAITLLELDIGVRLVERKDPIQGQHLRRWLDQQVRPTFAGRILPVDERVVLRCSPFHVPDPAPERDMLIAATGLVHAMTIVTRNSRDFIRSGVEIHNPWENGNG